jgi:hypothetical protein
VLAGNSLQQLLLAGNSLQAQLAGKSLQEQLAFCVLLNGITCSYVSANFCDLGACC